MKLSKKVKQEVPNNDPKSEDKTEKTFKLDGVPSDYVYAMYNNQVYDDTMTWGDLFRLFKYYRKFAKWDAEDGNRKLRVYPAKLKKD